MNNLQLQLDNSTQTSQEIARKHNDTITLRKPLHDKIRTIQINVKIKSIAQGITKMNEKIDINTLKHGSNKKL